MNLFERMRNGWHLSMDSLSVVRDHPKLLIFPLLSGGSLALILASFGIAVLSLLGLGHLVGVDQINTPEGVSDIVGYIGAFIFYFINYLVVNFFNVALVYSAREIFAGREFRISAALGFAVSRLRIILAWTAVAATVGMVLKVIEDKIGGLGALLANLGGLAWSIAVYFVVPVLAFESVGPREALRRSSALLREKWGEGLGANFSFGLLTLLGIVGAILGMILLFVMKLPIVAILYVVSTILLTILVVSATKNVFLAAAYAHTQGETPTTYYDVDTLDHLFYKK